MISSKLNIPMKLFYLVFRWTICIKSSFNSSLIDDILPDLKPNSFYFPPHKIIYETICELNDNNTTINLPNIITRLQDKNCLKKIGDWTNYYNFE
jgi:replicative DNA helicase